MAFATLTLARLFHGFNCRGKEPIFRLGLGSNRFSLLAFAGGTALLAAVLFVPGLSQLFAVTPLGAAKLDRSPRWPLHPRCSSSYSRHLPADNFAFQVDGNIRFVVS